jgi:hypothetical protein
MVLTPPQMITPLILLQHSLTHLHRIPTHNLIIGPTLTRPPLTLRLGIALLGGMIQMLPPVALARGGGATCSPMDMASPRSQDPAVARL